MALAKPSCQVQQGATKSTHLALQLPAGYQASGPDQSGIPLGSFSESSLDILGMYANLFPPPLPPPPSPRPSYSCSLPHACSTTALILAVSFLASPFVGGNPEVCSATCPSYVPLLCAPPVCPSWVPPPCAPPMCPSCPSYSHLLCAACAAPRAPPICPLLCCSHVLLPTAPAIFSALPCRWVRSVAVDPGNEWFATGSADRTIKIWDLASGQLKLTLTGHIEQVRLHTNCQVALGVAKGRGGEWDQKSFTWHVCFNMYSICGDVQHTCCRVYSYHE